MDNSSGEQDPRCEREVNDSIHWVNHSGGPAVQRNHVLAPHLEIASKPQGERRVAWHFDDDFAQQPSDDAVYPLPAATHHKVEGNPDAHSCWEELQHRVSFLLKDAAWSIKQLKEGWVPHEDGRAIDTDAKILDLEQTIRNLRRWEEFIERKLTD